MKYSRRPALVEAEQYFEDSDRSKFLSQALKRCECEGGRGRCSLCGKVFIQQDAHRTVVEDGDFVVLSVGSYSVIKPELFAEMFKREH